MKAILFDLGNILAHYYRRDEFPDILKQAIIEVKKYLSKENLCHVSEPLIWRNVKKEDYESSDNRVRPLEERLSRIFELETLSSDCELFKNMSRCFMKPIFERGYLYDEVLPTLKEIKERGVKTAIVSNTSWGSSGYLWREEISRLGLEEYIDELVFCRDVGWRKPAREIFQYALEKIKVLPKECIFVGDDPRWDVIGPRTAGIEPFLVTRSAESKTRMDYKSIHVLNELLDLITSKI